jgi:hypothetical protein
VTACQRAPGLGDDPREPLVSLYGVRIHHYRGDRVHAVGRAAKVAYDRVSADFNASELVMRFPRSDDPSAHGTEVRATEASGNLAREEIEGRREVIFRNDQGIRGVTEHARYHGQSDTAEGTKAVRVTGPDFTIDSVGFDFDFGSERYSFTGGARSVLGLCEAACAESTP